MIDKERSDMNEGRLSYIESLPGESKQELVAYIDQIKTTIVDIKERSWERQLVRMNEFNTLESNGFLDWFEKQSLENAMLKDRIK